MHLIAPDCIPHQVVEREAAAGRLRAYSAQPEKDAKVWLVDDYIYAAPESTGPNAIGAVMGTPSSGAAAANGYHGAHHGATAANGYHGQRPTPAVHGRGARWVGSALDTARGVAKEDDPFRTQRWYDETLLFSWRRGEDGVGRLWAGPGSDATRTLWDAEQGQRAVLHLMASKRLPAFSALRNTEHLRSMAAHALEFHVTKHGLWIKTSRLGKSHTWFAGGMGSAHLLLRSADVRRAMSQMMLLGKPTPDTTRRYARRMERLLPCAHAARRDDGKRPLRACAECQGEGGASSARARHAAFTSTKPLTKPCDVINVSAVLPPLCRRTLCAVSAALQ